MSGARSLADRARYCRGTRRLVLQEGRRVGTEQRGGRGSQSISNRPLLNPSPYRRGLFSFRWSEREPVSRSRLTPRVTLGEVGIILSIEVTRLARNCSDWYPLLLRWPRHSLKPSRPQKSMHYHGPARRSFRLTKHYGTRRNDKFSDCATRRRSPSVSSTVSIRITGSWPASLSGVGRRLSSNYAAQKKRWHDGRTQLRRRLSALIPACGQRW